MPTRRAVLIGGAVSAGLVGAGIGIEQGVLPGRPFLQAHLGLDGKDGVIPDIEPGPVEEGTFVSAARGGVETGWSLIRPPGSDGPLPLVVAMHWLGADHTTLTGPELGLDRYLAAHVADGGSPFAIVAADGGRSYWHPRPDGEDASRMVTDELLPMMVDRGYDTATYGLLGWSMGGYGALRLGGVLGSSVVRGTVASSPALWKHPEDASTAGFQDAADYRHATVFGHQGDLVDVAVWVDCGTGDPFYRDVQDYVDGFPEGAGVLRTFDRGGHTPGYWRRMLPGQLAFLSYALSGRRGQQPQV
jgi:hypothetical protein